MAGDGALRGAGTGDSRRGRRHEGEDGIGNNGLSSRQAQSPRHHRARGRPAAEQREYPDGAGAALRRLAAGFRAAGSHSFARLSVQAILASGTDPSAARPAAGSAGVPGTGLRGAGLAGDVRPDLDRHARLDADLLEPLLSLDHARCALPAAPSPTVDHGRGSALGYVAGGTFAGRPHDDGDRSLRRGHSRPTWQTASFTKRIDM